jgi:hypothetical protein
MHYSHNAANVPHPTHRIERRKIMDMREVLGFLFSEVFVNK